MTTLREAEGKLGIRGDIVVGVDARCLNTDHLRGMGKYVSEYVSHVNDSQQLHWRFFGDRPETAFHLPPGVSATTELFEVKGYRFQAWEQIGLPIRAIRRRIDLLHCAATSLPFWQPVPIVVTIHDMLPWKAQLAGYPHWYRHRLLPNAYKRASAIITISESSRQDILEVWPWLADKLHVIPHGVSDIYLNTDDFNRPAALTALVGDAPYLLYVGGAIERKRFSWALEVFKGLGLSELKLVVCGFNEQERRVATEALAPPLAERVCFLPFVPEHDMPGLYQHAMLVLYPTLYEGFGFPALEAQAVGTPVLFSGLASLSELQGPLAEVLPPNDLSAWIHTCKRIASAGNTAEGVRRTAREWASRYSWNISAERHCDVFRSIVEGR